MEYGVSLLGVTTVVSAEVNTRASLRSVLNGAFHAAESRLMMKSYITA